MIKLLFYQGFSRKKTELLLLFMIKISQISRKGAKQRKEITKTSAILRVSARENPNLKETLHCVFIFMKQ